MQYSPKATEKQKLLYVTLTNNWKQYCSILEKIEDTERKSASLSLVKNVSDRLIVCPSSSRVEYKGCFPGGLVWHSLNVYKNFELLRTALDLKKTVSSDSAIILSLFHDLGKLGTLKDDYYQPQNSEWHKEKLGQMFTINPDLANISYASRTFEWLAGNGIALEAKEFEAIITTVNRNNDTLTNVNNTKDSPESFLLQAAVKAALLNSSPVDNILDT
jgi:hypothetical protein